MSEITAETWTGNGLPLPDILVAGTPCQAFSLVGARKGLDDPRGNLTLKFVLICHAIQDAKHDGRLAAVWENVPGVLTDKTNAFGALLSGVVGGDDPFPAPDDAGWPRAGLVAGPRGRAAWRVLDAQYFGVAQRRERVFLVASLGDGPDPASILFERQGLHGNPAPRRDAGKADRGASARGAGNRRGRIEANSGDISFCLASNMLGSGDYEGETLIVEGLAVRRLTPHECHRLQGFADDHCAIERRGKPAADGPQYKALGNSMAVPVMRWILRRLLGLPVELRPHTERD
ncbi:DNA cytosine methyltransferase [Allgaiera indica]